ncbi:hypothetical protein [Mycoplasma sp. Z244B]|uniref:hypothetical protein n=1 Tax=Mycoplasma sp. Z244B TaxID=3401659 RepID=UPI003AAEEEDA
MKLKNILLSTAISSAIVVPSTLISLSATTTNDSPDQNVLAAREEIKKEIAKYSNLSNPQKENINKAINAIPNGTQEQINALKNTIIALIQAQSKINEISASYIDNILPDDDATLKNQITDVQNQVNSLLNNITSAKTDDLNNNMTALTQQYDTLKKKAKDYVDKQYKQLVEFNEQYFLQLFAQECISTVDDIHSIPELVKIYKVIFEIYSLYTDSNSMAQTVNQNQRLPFDENVVNWNAWMQLTQEQQQIANFFNSLSYGTPSSVNYTYEKLVEMKNNISEQINSWAFQLKTGLLNSMNSKISKKYFTAEEAKSTFEEINKITDIKTALSAYNDATLLMEKYISLYVMYQTPIFFNKLKQDGYIDKYNLESQCNEILKQVQNYLKIYNENTYVPILLSNAEQIIAVVAMNIQTPIANAIFSKITGLNAALQKSSAIQDLNSNAIGALQVYYFDNWYNTMLQLRDVQLMIVNDLSQIDNLIKINDFNNPDNSTTLTEQQKALSDNVKKAYQFSTVKEQANFDKMNLYAKAYINSLVKNLTSSINIDSVQTQLNNLTTAVNNLSGNQLLANIKTNYNTLKTKLAPTILQEIDKQSAAISNNANASALLNLLTSLNQAVNNFDTDQINNNYFMLQQLQQYNFANQLKINGYTDFETYQSLYNDSELYLANQEYLKNIQAQFAKVYDTNNDLFITSDPQAINAVASNITSQLAKENATVVELWNELKTNLHAFTSLVNSINNQTFLDKLNKLNALVSQYSAAQNISTYPGYIIFDQKYKTLLGEFYNAQKDALNNNIKNLLNNDKKPSTPLPQPGTTPGGTPEVKPVPQPGTTPEVKPAPQAGTTHETNSSVTAPADNNDVDNSIIYWLPLLIIAGVIGITGLIAAFTKKK